LRDHRNDLRTTQQPQPLHCQYQRYAPACHMQGLTTMKDVPEPTTITATELITSGHTADTFTCGATNATSTDCSRSNYIHHLPVVAPSHTIIEADGWLCDSTCVETYAATKPAVVSPLRSRNPTGHPMPYPSCSLPLTLDQ